MARMNARRLADSGAAREIRRQAKVPLADVAADLGVAPTTVWRWENGLRHPRGEIAERWLEMLGEIEPQYQPRHAARDD